MSALTDSYYDHGRRMLENWKWRNLLHDEMDSDSKFAATERKLCQTHWSYSSGKQKLGILRFFENHLWTHEPRGNIRELYGPEFKKLPSLPFLLFDFQEDAVKRVCEAIDSGKDILIEKTRDMGISWLIVSIFFYYWWLDESGNDFLLGSRKLEYVDKKGAADTLFEKVRYNLYYLVDSMMPEGFEVNKHDNVGFIVNPASGNYLRGESNNANFATSGRYKAILIDEFAKWEETDVAAWTSMGDSSPCRIPVSTPYGIGRKFAQLAKSDSIETLTFHWTQHPIKSAGMWQGPHPYDQAKGDVWLSEWYLTEVERRKDNPEANIGQELDIDYLSSGTPYFRYQMKKIQDLYEGLKDEKIGQAYDFLRVDRDEVDIFESELGKIVIRKEPVEGWRYRYLIACDVAEGLEKGDNSVFYVYDRVEGEDVAWFVGKVDTYVLYLLLLHFGYMYDDAYIGVESNNHGHGVIQNLKQVYENLYYQEEFSKVIDMETAKVGYHTNVATRKMMVAMLREAIDQDYHGIFDAQAFRECMTFVNNKNGKPEADVNCLDDRVMAQAIKWVVHNWMDSPSQVFESKKKEYGAPRFGGIKPEKKRDIRQIWV